MKTKITERKSALDTALSYLSRRALTYYELQSRLGKKGYYEAEIEETLKRVKGWGYVNDKALALSFAQVKLVNFSRSRVKQDLLKRGIVAELVDEVLGGLYQPEQELSQCVALARKMWSEEAKRWENSYQYKKTYMYIPRELFLKQKVGQKLMQKGYQQEVIRQALEDSLRWD